MAKKTHIKVRLVPESNPDSKIIYYAKKPTKGEKAKNKIMHAHQDRALSFPSHTNNESRGGRISRGCRRPRPGLPHAEARTQRQATTACVC